MAELESRLVDEVTRMLQEDGFSERRLDVRADLYQDMGCDSVEKTQIIAHLESHFGLPRGTLLDNAGIRTVEDLVLLLAKQGVSYSTYLAGTVLLRAGVVTKHPGVNLDRIDLDSLDWVEVFGVLEDDYGFRSENGSMDHLLGGSVEDLVRYIEEQLEETHGTT